MKIIVRFLLDALVLTNFVTAKFHATSYHKTNT